jgi:polyisoprenoid-binding protein YceI
MRHAAIRLAMSFSLFALPAGLLRAERKAYVPDRAHCQLNFIGEALLLSAHGHFEKWEIDTQLNAANLEDSSVQLQIESTSLNTRIEQRDKHLRSADFLDVANHPQIKFVSTRVKKLDDKTLTITGDLTLRGVTKKVDVPVKVVFMRDGDARFKGELQINRKDYGINYNSRMNPVEDMVTIQFDMHLLDKAVQEERQRQRQAAPPRPPQ